MFEYSDDMTAAAAFDPGSGPTSVLVAVPPEPDLHHGAPPQPDVRHRLPREPGLLAGLRGVHAAIDALAPGGTRAGGGGVDVAAGLDALAAQPGGCARALTELDRAITRLQAHRLAVIAAADRAALPERAGAASTGAWVATRTRATGAKAAADARLATALDGALPLTGAALADGRLSAEHAVVIADTTSRLPHDLTGNERARVEHDLVDKATRMDPGELRRAARRALTAAGRPRDEVDAAEDASLRTEEDRALARTRLTWHDNLDGTITGHFTVPTLAGEILRKTIQQMTSPRRHAPDPDQAPTTARATGSASACVTDPEPGLGARARAAQRRWDTEDWAHRRGLALVELLEHLPTDRLPGKVAATVVVTIDVQSLRGGLAAASLDTGTDLSAGQARRLACNAGILPAVLDGRSQVLDLGMTKRYFTEAHKVALATKHSQCAADGCDRPYAWCDLHHAQPWSRGGPTDLANAIPLCGYHHRLAHAPDREHITTRHPDGHTTVTFHPRP
jgi:hypothetical protein